MKSKKKFSSEFKVKVVLEILKERHTVAEIANKYELQSTQLSKWKQDFLSKAFNVFEESSTPQDKSDLEKDQLYRQIGKLQMENEFLKKKLY